MSNIHSHIPTNQYQNILERCREGDRGLRAIGSALIDTIYNALSNMSDDTRSKKWPDVKRDMGIYSVNRRIKRSARIAQKLDEFAKKNSEIEFSCDTFQRCIPDIIGARVVCLHPDDLFQVAVCLQKLGESEYFSDPPSWFKKYRVRRGAFSLLDKQLFEGQGFHVDPQHDTGYTSIHFVFQLTDAFIKKISSRQDLDDISDLKDCGVMPDTLLVEIQLRTILEEAWGEIDHWIRYEDETLIKDPDLKSQFRAMAGYIQAGNHHVSLIRELARNKLGNTHKRVPEHLVGAS